MFSGFLKFNEIPEIGFAQHYYYEGDYLSKYNKKKERKSFEIVYVNSGGITAELYGEKTYAKEGCIFVLFRHLPITLTSTDNTPQSHCTVQAELDYDFELLDGECENVDADGILLPFITEPCRETEEIKKELYSIVADMNISRERESFSSALRILGIMQKIDRIARKKSNLKKSSSSIISYKVKKYVAENIEKNISLSKIAEKLGKTPNYINFAFKEDTGITINRYINKEKVKRIAELMKNQKLSFKTACENAAITDISYGYRLFKKHMGITPGEYTVKL